MLRAAVFNDTSWTFHHGCNAVMQMLVGGLASRGVRPTYLWPVGRDWQPHAGHLARVPADVLIVNGEGTIHHSAERDRARYLCRLARFAEESLRIPSVLVNASVTEIEAEAMGDLRRFTRIYVRETETRDYLARNGIYASVVSDLSMAVAHSPKASRSGILVTDSVLPDVTAALRALAERIGASYESMREPPSSLLKWTRSLRRRWPVSLPGYRSLVRTSDYFGFLERLSGSSAVVTGRFHTVTLCLLTDTPFLAVTSNTRKIEAVLHDALGNQGRVVSPAELAHLTPTELMSRAEFSEKELQALARYRQQSLSAQQEMFSTISAIAKGEQG